MLTLRELENRYIVYVVTECNGSLKEASKILGITTRGLQMKRKRGELDQYMENLRLNKKKILKVMDSLEVKGVFPTNKERLTYLNTKREKSIKEK